jgi:hypothetical protein
MEFIKKTAMLFFLGISVQIGIVCALYDKVTGCC